MRLNNTSDNKKIIKRNVPLKEMIVGGVVIFSLATAVLGINQMKPEILDSEEYGFYSTHYLDNLRSEDESNYDSNFVKIYNDVTYTCGDNTYSGLSIYIVSYDDGSVHLIDSDNRSQDLITGDDITGKRVHVMPFRESSVFYELYASGIIQGENVTLSDTFLNYISRWNGEKHYQTVDLVAEQKTSLEYQERYGGK